MRFLKINAVTNFNENTTKTHLVFIYLIYKT